MKWQKTILQLILTGVGMYRFYKIQKIPVHEMSRIKLGHRWSDLSKSSSSYICSSIHDSQIDAFYILIAVSPLTDQTKRRKEESDMETMRFYYVHTFLAVVLPQQDIFLFVKLKEYWRVT